MAVEQATSQQKEHASAHVSPRRLASGAALRASSTSAPTAALRPTRAVSVAAAAAAVHQEARLRQR
eukprot:2104300-Pleurochrysis_carterae.AAC.2